VEGSGPTSTPAKTGVLIHLNNKGFIGATEKNTRLDRKRVTTIVLYDLKIQGRLQAEDNNSVITMTDTRHSDVVHVQLNGQTVEAMATRGDMIKIVRDDSTYKIAASQIELEQILAQMSPKTEPEDIKVTISVAASPEEIQNQYQQICGPIEFGISCTDGERTVNLSKMSGYVDYTIKLPEGIEPNNVSTAVLLGSDGTLSPVPTQIVEQEGRYFAKIKSMSNGTFALIYNPMEFKDVETHWSKDEVNDLGSKLILSGMGDGTFEPDRRSTRAEFVATLVNALALVNQDEAQDPFKDVTSDKWYYHAVSIASEQELISGYGDGFFLPDNQITKEEVITILTRTMNILNMNTELSDEEYVALLANFNNENELHLSRAEAAVMIQRLLMGMN
jgi:hypothetical protein